MLYLRTHFSTMPPRKNSKNSDTSQKIPRKGKPRIVKTNSESPNDIKIEIPVKKCSDIPRRVTRNKILNDEQKLALVNESNDEQKTALTNKLLDPQETALVNNDSPQRFTKTKILYKEQKIAFANEDSSHRVTSKKILNDEQKIELPNEMFDEKNTTLACEQFDEQKTESANELFDEKKNALANEVVRHQLNRKPRSLNIQKKIPTVEVINHKGKPKPVVSNDFETQAQSEQVGNVNDNPKKKVTKKTTSDGNMVAKKALTRKRSADSTQKTEKCITAKKTNVEPKRRRIAKNNIKDQKVPEKGIIEGKINVTEELKNENEVTASTMMNVQANGIQSLVSNCAGHIESRKTSSTSNSWMSWTKDLSTSSRTSVAATSSDFVRIDKKMPILKLTSIVNEIDEKTVNDNDISSVDSDSSDSTNSEKSSNAFNIQSQNLNLTPHFLSNLPITNVKSHQNNPLKDEMSKAFDKLTSKLKLFDLEIMSWIGYAEENADDGMKNFQDKMIETLKEEREAITYCQRLKITHSKDGELKSSENDSDELVVKKHIDKVNVTPRNISECMSKRKNSPDHQVVHNSLAETGYNDNNHVNSKSNENYDDEDAISIYAESITGMESERLSNSFTQACKDLEHVEYIPEPIKKSESLPKKYTYCPTKISENNQLILKKSVCEKQNADSTSIFKDFHCERASEGDFNSISSECTQDNINNDCAKIAELPQANLYREPLLINGNYKAQGHKGGIFKYICNFNLYNRCKNSRCRYLHVIPDVEEIKNKLHELSNEAFVSEYMAVRKIHSICRKYGSCFVEECSNRNMLRLLVDMARNFFMNAVIISKDDNIYIREILEIILLKLNTADLDICEDLLMHSVTPTMLLCDIFMQTIAETQNFARFKIVFLNLTHFIVRQGGLFNLFVAEHILERVCILPPEKPLARALLDIMRNTDTAIFRNNMVGKFENILLTLDTKLHSDFLSIKMEAIGSMLTSPSDSNASSQLSNNVGESIIPVNTTVNLGDKVYTSPDTTEVNSSKNKFPSDFKLTRTVNFNQPSFKEPSKTNPLNKNVENSKKTEMFKNMGHKFGHKFPPLSLSYPGTRPSFGLVKNKRYVAYKPTVTRYQRNPQREF